MSKVISNNFVDAIVDTNDTLCIIYEGIKYYQVINYDFNNIEFLTINFGKRDIIYSIVCVKYKDNYYVCCYLTDKKIINGIEIEGIYIKINSIVKLRLKFTTYDATFKNKNCCEAFNDFDEISRNEFNELTNSDMEDNEI
jgi:hypothetical protein